MTDADARDHPPGARSGWHPWLLLLLVFTLAPRAIDDRLADLGTRLAAHNPLLFWLPLTTGGIEIVGLLVAGVLVDRYGIRNVICLSLVAWALVIVSLAAFVRASPILYLAHDGAVFAGLFFGLAANVTAKRVFPFTRRARFLAVLDIASVAWLLGGPSIATAAHWPPVSSSDPAWIQGGLVIAGGAVLLAILWWAVRRREVGPAPAALGTRLPTASLVETMTTLRRPGMIALVLVMTCHMLVFSTLYRVLPLYIVRVRFLPLEALVRALVLPLVAYAVTKMVVASWSDARARKTGSVAHARVPFVVAGAALAATIGLIPVVANASLGAVFWPLAFGMAVFPLVFTLALDVVPAAMAGRFLALAFAAALAVNLAVFVLASVISKLTNSVSPYFYLAAASALTGAIIAFARLRGVEPIEESPGFAQAIGKVFA